MSERFERAEGQGRRGGYIELARDLEDLLACDLEKPLYVVRQREIFAAIDPVEPDCAQPAHGGFALQRGPGCDLVLGGLEFGLGGPAALELLELGEDDLDRHAPAASIGLYDIVASSAMAGSTRA